MAPALRDLFLLRPEVVFLNHGSFGACPRPVFEAYQQWQEELERQPVEFLGRRFRDLMQQARQALAAYVGADPQDLVYVPNATVGVNIAARSLPLGPGDEVLSTDHEYGAMRRMWRTVCEERGARYVEAPVPVPVESDEEIVERIWTRVNVRTRVFFCSHLTSPTALILPVAGLIRRAREAGIMTIVDGAHAPGQIPVHLADLGADVYAANCHKWMCAQKGSGFLYVRRELQHFIKPLVISWGDEGETRAASRFLDELEWQGTQDIAAYLAVPAAIGFQRDHQWEAVREDCHTLAREVRERITGLTGLPPLSPDSPDWYAQMVSLPLPASDARRLQRRLLEEHGIEAPVMAWSGRALLRISLQGYNTRDDVDAVVSAVPRVLDGG
ncbi:MAG TPA: aminotransferase class V-fold PLP-dependent enzyme [bacterium]|nr:aminotransferase class V-fold PLP-dependent enzyme [bacterium]